ncbi:MAG: adenylyltransferase/cytidyltransferase family protein [Thermoplasmataceae archaeon]
MKKVMATGVFDILHPGHLHYLNESRKLGDYLTVVIARDVTAERNGKKLFFDEKSRLKMVSYLRMVDEAILGSKVDIFDTVSNVQPDIITLGYDQKFSSVYIEEEVEKRGINVKVVRITPYLDEKYQNSSSIRNRLMKEI